ISKINSNESKMSKDSRDLWSKVVEEGIEDRVEVNQRMLIDKMLARYSSDFVVLRELIQNSDDAQSTSFTLQIFCEKTNCQIVDEEENHRNLFENLGNSIRNYLTTNSEHVNEENQLESEYHHCLISEIRTKNNGKVFNEDDWKRVITIAEGNTNVDAIGQFGVGFFSVFSYSEKPMIKSGKHCLAFAWQNGKSLTTFRKELPENDQSTSTAILLPMKNSFLLETKINVQMNKKGHISSTNRSKKSKRNAITNEILPILNLNELKTYLIKVLSFTKYLNELIIEINQQIIFKITKTIEIIPQNRFSSNIQRLNTNSNHQFIFFNSLIQTKQTFSIENSSSITLNHLDVEAKIRMEKSFQTQIENVLKKSLPSTIHLLFLFPSTQIFEEEQWKLLKDRNSLLKHLIPLKLNEKEILPDGQIFIGLATHQSTGIGMHLSSHLIPTIERENLDLQDPFISIWNEQLLISIGQIIRFIYDQTILHLVNQLENQSIQLIHSILSPYAFIQSSPNKDIGRILVEGFFSSDKDILVPVRRCPTDKHLSLIPSSEAYLIRNDRLEKFLPIPLVP
ncbi:unnamed protein product, partial [Adineta ricciae]